MIKELKTLLPYIKRYIPHYAAGLACLLVTNGLQLYIPQLVRQAIDRISSGNFQITSIIRILIIMLIAGLLIAVGRFGWRLFIQRTSRRIEKELRGTLYTHVQTLSEKFFNVYKTGDLMARFTNDMDAIRMATGMALVAFMDGVFMTIAILIIMLNTNVRLTLYTIAPLPVITILVLIFGRIIREKYSKVQEGFSLLNNIVSETISGIRVIKTFVEEKSFIKKFVDQNDEYSKRNLSLAILWGGLFPMVRLLAGITSMMFIIFGSRALIIGTISPGEFTAFLAYITMLIWPMLGAGFVVNILQRAEASMKRINEILQEEPAIKSPAHGIKSGITGHITIKDLTYTYEGQKNPVLNNINLDIPAGKKLGILGTTGSGKTTLIKLLPRILGIDSGNVFIDGVDINDYDLEYLRSSISAAPQDSFLFSMSIKDNILFGGGGDGTEQDQALFEKIIYSSSLERDLENFPEHWETVIGEKGITLSGGQKQRVALARSLFKESPIYIFDDTFSAVDTKTENFILTNLLSSLENKTGIIISHRISTLKTADFVIVLDNGAIIQQGTHEQLLETEGLYAEIYRIQQMEK